ncbi:3-oxoacyl-[acyl-carrier-protein] reductase FabG-like [Spodoptera frugiperda]|uniref:3-oxoacyl-[acyl-carrier-protein] reductase FabG-like n=1 Tax=Spodoptera frugiperda TaxID=7108 RepID=A0A9R0DD08_SPOFR|nr:3-oxoacyl-[acyl-carrier-protein] reductase FabG-like [Spodoptera frugiperda]
MSFKNKVVLITGGSAGIGAATAEQFAKEGASVAIVGRNEAGLKAVTERCDQYGSKTLVIKADVADDAQAKTIVEKTIEAFGRLDVLVNNAAVYKSTSLLSPDIMKIYDEVTSVDLRAVVHMTSLAAPHLIKTKGNIVNISSVLGKTYVQSPQLMMYCLSKAALEHFSRGAALELAASGVRVNIVSPGPVRTALVKILETENIIEDVSLTTALHRVSEPEEVADVILFLASDKAKGVTGSDYGIDNGVTIKF